MTKQGDSRKEGKVTRPSDFERRWVGRLRRKNEPRDSEVVVAASFLAALNWAVANSSAPALLGTTPCCKS